MQYPFFAFSRVGVMCTSSVRCCRSGAEKIIIKNNLDVHKSPTTYAAIVRPRKFAIAISSYTLIRIVLKIVRERVHFLSTFDCTRRVDRVPTPGRIIYCCVTSVIVGRLLDYVRHIYGNVRRNQGYNANNNMRDSRYRGNRYRYSAETAAASDFDEVYVITLDFVYRRVL